MKECWPAAQQRAQRSVLKLCVSVVQSRLAPKQHGKMTEVAKMLALPVLTGTHTPSVFCRHTCTHMHALTDHQIHTRFANYLRPCPAAACLQVVTAKSSEVNLLVVAANPEAEDVAEHAVPEQFISTFVNGKLVTTAASHG